MTHKVLVDLDEDDYVALLEAYSLKEAEALLSTMLHKHIQEHIRDLKADDAPSLDQSPDKLDHSPHEWTR
jgi:Mg/Co/Ni transporter MgtE